MLLKRIRIFPIFSLPIRYEFVNSSNHVMKNFVRDHPASIYYVSTFLDSFGPTHYVSINIVLIVSKKGHYLNPLIQSICWRNIWMIPNQQTNLKRSKFWLQDKRNWLQHPPLPHYEDFLCSISSKIHSFLKQWFSFYENKVLQLMSDGASLERFGERTLFTKNEDLADTVLKTNGL